uniref:Ubiquitin-like protease family profile domain-containing protein n=1 Tax=Glossina pallidipes TaxID=7398 RepID=A0A1B0A7K8_GLOPL
MNALPAWFARRMSYSWIINNSIVKKYFPELRILNMTNTVLRAVGNFVLSNHGRTPSGGYPTEDIATNMRRYIEFLNRMKYRHDVNLDHHAMPLRVVSVPRQANSANCGVFLLRNLEVYLNQNEDGWDPLTLPTVWCTALEARHTRMAIAAMLLELAGEEGRAHTNPTEAPGTSEPAEDVVLLTPKEKPIPVRAMSVVEQPRVIAEDYRQEPIALGVIKPRHPVEEIDSIEPTIGLLSEETPPSRLEFANNAEWVPLEEDDPLCQYLRKTMENKTRTKNLDREFNIMRQNILEERRRLRAANADANRMEAGGRRGRSLLIFIFLRTKRPFHYCTH